MIPLQCPTCRKRLFPSETRLSCECGASFDIADGIPVLTSSATYYGEVSLERKQGVLDLLDRGFPWRTVVWEAFGTSYAFLHHIIVDEARNDFRYVLPWLPEGVVLDLGAGWGTMATHFARDYRQVVAMDGTLDRAQFIQKRCRQDGVTNVECVCANVLESPLPEEFFDIVLMNGVLEWIGASSQDGAPRDLQLAALRAVRRMLKPDGVLYIGIENSHGFKYILGENDDHTGIPHITYLTRDRADARSRRELKRPYRTYTYDRVGYEHLLTEAGFLQSRFYYPAPDYKSTHVLMDLNAPGQVAFYNRELKAPADPGTTAERVRSLEIAAEAHGHVGNYVASYSIVAGTPSAPSLVSAVAAHVRAEWSRLLPAGAQEPVRVDVLQMASASGKRFERGRLKLFIFVDGQTDPAVIATVCRDPDYDASLAAEVDIFSLPVWRNVGVFHVPEHATLESVVGRPVLFRRAWQGTSFETRLGRLRYGPSYDANTLEAAVRDDFSAASDVLAALHRATRETSTSTSAYLDGVFRNISTRWSPGLFSGVEEARQVVETVYGGAGDCLLHGDFTPSNILRLGEAPGGLGLIDWELASRHGATIVDYGRFAYYYLAHLETMQTELGATRDELLRRVFVTRQGWLSEVVGVPVKTLPRLHELRECAVRVEDIRDISLQDLLSRGRVGMDLAPIRKLLRGRRVLVTGAGGSIGSELCRQIVSNGSRMLILVDHAENGLFHITNELADRGHHAGLHPLVGDVTDLGRMGDLFGRYRPEIVFHAAAHKHVPLMEANVCEAVTNNVTGTRVVAEVAERHGVERFVMISSDKAVNPTSVMGATKRVGELLLQTRSGGSDTTFVMVRFGNVLGSNGSVVPRFVRQIDRGGPVTVTHPDVRRFFMLIQEAVQLVLNSAALGEPGKLYVLKIGEQVKVVDLARDLIRLAGFVPDRDIPISFIGLRPGEKLFEELVGADERASRSRCDEIMEVAPVGRVDRIALASGIVGLEQRARQNDAAAVMDCLGTLVPTFRQNRERLLVGPEGVTVGIPAGDSPATGTTASHDRPGHICPACASDSVIGQRVKSRAARTPRPASTARSYRCLTCGWRGWLTPVELFRSTTADGAGTVAEANR